MRHRQHLAALSHNHIAIYPVIMNHALRPTARSRDSGSIDMGQASKRRRHAIKQLHTEFDSKPSMRVAPSWSCRDFDM